MIGSIKARATPAEILLETHEGHGEIALPKDAGVERKGRQISVVAGAGFEPATFGL
jgi:hypothetical protein